MRIRTVTIEGFGPFRDRQTIDFSRFDADGLFLIAGETGVGKTSILDAIAYALYNRTPRWDNVSAKGAASSVRSDFCGLDDRTEVVVDFETNGREYRVTRSPEFERQKRRGDGTTTEGSRVLVEVRDDEASSPAGTAEGRWLARATKEKEAAELVEGLLKLNKDEFLQVIMLAQGRFQEFLLATSDKRLELLSKLFGTGRFADYQNRVAERRSALGSDVDVLRATRAALLDGIAAPEEVGPIPQGGERVWLDRVVEFAQRGAAAAAEAFVAAQDAERLATERLSVAGRQARLSDAQSALAALAARDDEVARVRLTVERAERAERVRPLLAAVGTRKVALDRASSTVRAARARYAGEVADESLAAEVARLDTELGSLTDALAREQQATQLGRQVTDQRAEVEAITESMARTISQIDHLSDERRQLAPLSAQRAGLAGSVTRTEAKLAAARAEADTEVRLRAAQEALLDARRRVTEARRNYELLLGRFLDGQAGILATRLVDGQPCQVCGSTDHPAPAAMGNDAVTEVAVDRARSEVGLLEPVEKNAQDAVGRIEVELAGLRATSTGADATELARELEDLTHQLSEADDAASRIRAIDAELDGDSELGAMGLNAERTRIEEQHRQQSDSLAGLQSQQKAATESIDRARGEFATVSDRVDALTETRRATKELADAITGAAESARQHSQALDEANAQCVDEGFSSTSEAFDALLDAADAAGLRQLIAEHTNAIAENKGVLKSPDLQDLPEEVIDPNEANQAHELARDALTLATAQRANADRAVEDLIAKRAKLQELDDTAQDLDARFELLDRLSNTMNGRGQNTRNMSLESYYLAAELEEVLHAANGRLRKMSQGRFELRHSEQGARRAGVAAGLELEILDEYTGRSRPTHTLSGGQQFLASLALALGLAEVVTARAGGVELNTLFVDEGFGSLSSEFLEIAMETLDSLKQGGRTVGVISHVASMKDQIAAQLQVVAEPGGPSRVVSTQP